MTDSLTEAKNTGKTYFTVEVVIPMSLYNNAKDKADTLGEDMAHVARRILYAAGERPPEQVGQPITVGGAAKTRGNTRGSDALYKNFRFRVPRDKYRVVKAAIVGVPGQTVTHALELGLQRYIRTGQY